MDDLTRRSFLERAGLVSAATVVGVTAAACGDSSGRTPRPTLDSIVDHPPAESGIDTIVVLMMENRSFDHYLGWLAKDDEYLDAGKRRFGSRFHIVGKQNVKYRDSEGKVLATASLVGNPNESDPYRGCGHPIPGHGWYAGRAQMRNGFVGKGTGNDEYAIGYYESQHVPFYAELARNYTVADHWHASLLGGTFPNRQYLHAGTSNGNKEDPVPLKVGVFSGPTIWDQLERAGVDARYYHVDLPILTLWGEQYADRISNTDAFFEDAAGGTLPAFTMIDPGFQGPLRSDDHAVGDIRTGQRFVREVVRAVMKSPQWERTAFVLCYDEWGGFFDHVQPPQLADDRASIDEGNNFGQAGFRVPAMMLSPRSMVGAVSHAVYDHTSILRFVQWRFLGAPGAGTGAGSSRWWLSKRNRHAANAGQMLSTHLVGADPRFDLDLELRSPTANCLEVAVSAEPGGEGLGANGEWATSAQLDELTASEHPDAEALPWILG